AGADPADVLQRAVLAGRRQQRTERGARALWGGVADDHELIRLRVLGLDPAPGAAGDVAGPDALADDALHALLAAGGEDLRAVPDDVLAVSEHGRRAFEQFLQQRLALVQASARQVLPGQR